MSKHKPRCCANKVRHDTAPAARAEAWRLRQAGEPTMTWYRCGRCRGWHVGHAAGPRAIERLLAAAGVGVAFGLLGVWKAVEIVAWLLGG